MSTIIFLDCEFTGLVKDAELISLCLYHDDTNYLYAEFNDFNRKTLSPWHSENVNNKLFFESVNTVSEQTGNIIRIKGDKTRVAEKIKEWLEQYENIEIWGDVPAWDWVLFCDLFGGALNIPGQIHYICGDIATLFMAKGLDKDINRADFVKEMLKQVKGDRHNALFDAKVTKLCYEKLTNGNV